MNDVHMMADLLRQVSAWVLLNIFYRHEDLPTYTSITKANTFEKNR